VWREAFGFRSSAAVLAALARVPFKDNIRSPLTWTQYHQRFVAILHQAPVARRPPLTAVAEVFMTNCCCDFIEKDVLAHEPADHDAALRLVIDRLNDSGFLQNDGLSIRRHNDAAKDSHRRGEVSFQPRPDRVGFRRDDQDRSRRDDRQRRDDAPRRDGQRDHHAPCDDAPRRPPSDSATGRPASAPPMTCRRCNRSGHTEESCICKHDSDSKRLPEVEPAVYAKRKEKAVALAAGRLQSVHAIASDSSDTEDVDAEAESLLHKAAGDDADTSDVDLHQCLCIYSEDDPCDTAPISISVYYDRYVPAPSLLRCGDVESNPGPARYHDSRRRAPLRVQRNAGGFLPHLVFNNASSAPQTCSRLMSSPMSPSPAVIVVMFVAIYWLWHKWHYGRQTDPILPASTAASPTTSPASPPTDDRTVWHSDSDGVGHERPMNKNGIPDEPPPAVMSCFDGINSF
jgi:hypothetical protein